MGNIALYTQKVNLPCPNCGRLISVKLDEKIEFCPFCHASLFEKKEE